MKRMLYFVMALALVLGFTQCKKDQMEQQGERVHITLDVDGGNSNSRVVVDPTNGGANNYASVTFENGDVIYVAYNNAYVGTLTYSGSAFSGDIDITQSGDQPLHFYCLGGKGFTVNRDGNTVTVVISDQSTKYPVISYAPSNEYYSSGSTSYTAKLLNKCSIMKFDVTTPSTAAVCITGMNNKVTVDFSKVAETGTGLTGSTTDNGFTYGQVDGGLITIPGVASSGASTWAIVLPQDALTTTGDAYSADNAYIGTRPTMGTITSNQYLSTGVALTVNTAAWDGDLSKLTSSSSESFATARDGMTITGTLGVGVNKKISIADGATVTLNNVTINGTKSSSYKWAGITCLGDATIILSGTNTVKGFYDDYPGIQAAVGKTLTINGTGSLTASSNGYGVGIGGGYNIACGNIEIQGGTVEATGGNQAAGIGGGRNANCGTITISGGTVTATGGSSGAGIGSGDHGTCGTITISGGTVTATGGNNGGAGIGSGLNAGCGDITITTGVTKVTATRGSGAPNSIGAGNGESTCGTVTIGGNVGAITTSPYTYQP